MLSYKSDSECNKLTDHLLSLGQFNFSFWIRQRRSKIGENDRVFVCFDARNTVPHTFFTKHMFLFMLSYSSSDKTFT